MRAGGRRKYVACSAITRKVSELNNELVEHCVTTVVDGEDDTDRGLLSVIVQKPLVLNCARVQRPHWRCAPLDPLAHRLNLSSYAYVRLLILLFTCSLVHSGRTDGSERQCLRRRRRRRRRGPQPRARSPRALAAHEAVAISGPVDGSWTGAGRSGRRTAGRPVRADARRETVWRGQVAADRQHHHTREHQLAALDDHQRHARRTRYVQVRIYCILVPIWCDAHSSHFATRV